VGALVDFLATKIPTPEIHGLQRKLFGGQVDAMGSFVVLAGTRVGHLVFEGAPKGTLTHVTVTVNKELYDAIFFLAIFERAKPGAYVVDCVSA